jgi:hypothetical protein
MATITLTAATNYSALTVASGDTIDCAGFRLTLNTQPAETNISVVSPGTAGRVTITGALDLSTWSFTPGTGTMIDNQVPSGATVGTINGGSAISAIGCATNNGTVINVNGGSANSASGILNNNGTITNVVGGSAVSAFGVNNNNNAAAATNATGGTVAAINGNFGQVTNAYGAAAPAITANSGTVVNAFGSTTANVNAIVTNNGTCLNLDDNTGDAIGTFNGRVFFCLGPGVLGKIKAPITTIYSLGKMSTSATLPAGSTLIEMKEGLTGGGFPLSRVVN